MVCIAWGMYADLVPCMHVSQTLTKRPQQHCMMQVITGAHSVTTKSYWCAMQAAVLGYGASLARTPDYWLKPLELVSSAADEAANRTIGAHRQPSPNGRHTQDGATELHDTLRSTTRVSNTSRLQLIMNVCLNHVMKLAPTCMLKLRQTDFINKYAHHTQPMVKVHNDQQSTHGQQYTP